MLKNGSVCGRIAEAKTYENNAVIPDYKLGAYGWEKERSYFNNFSYRAEAKGGNWYT